MATKGRVKLLNSPVYFCVYHLEKLVITSKSRHGLSNSSCLQYMCSKEKISPKTLLWGHIQCT